MEDANMFQLLCGYVRSVPSSLFRRKMVLCAVLCHDVYFDLVGLFLSSVDLSEFVHSSGHMETLTLVFVHVKSPVL
jgi:hypothetical protein